MYSLPVFICLAVALLSSALHVPGYHGSGEEVVAAPTLSGQQVIGQPLGETASELVQDHVDDHPYDDDDEPMVWDTPVDYRTIAIQERERLIADGADPDSIVLESEIPNHVPKGEGDCATRYVETVNAMIQRGVTILNDMTTVDSQANGLGFPNGRQFDLRGATKGEFREISQLHYEAWDEEKDPEIPEKFLKFELPVGEGFGDVGEESGHQ